MGVFEFPRFAEGTFAIARKVAESKAVSIIGGGDSVSAINQSGLSDKITHISTGGAPLWKCSKALNCPGWRFSQINKLFSGEPFFGRLSFVSKRLSDQKILLWVNDRIASSIPIQRLLFGL